MIQTEIILVIYTTSATSKASSVSSKTASPWNSINNYIHILDTLPLIKYSVIHYNTIKAVTFKFYFLDGYAEYITLHISVKTLSYQLVIKWFYQNDKTKSYSNLECYSS